MVHIIHIIYAHPKLRQAKNSEDVVHNAELLIQIIEGLQKHGWKEIAPLFTTIGPKWRFIKGNKTFVL